MIDRMSLRLRPDLPADAPAGLGPTPRLGVLRFLADPVRHGLALARSGRVVPVSKHNPALVLASGPDVVREFFTSPVFQRPRGGLVDPPRSSPKAQAVFDGMILMPDGGPQRARRRLLLARTHDPKTLDVHAATMAATAGECLAEAPLGPVDVFALASRIARRNLIRCLLGLADAAEVEALAAKIQHVSAQLLNPAVAATRWLADKLNDGAPVGGTSYAAWTHACEALHDAVAEVVDRRRDLPAGPDVLWGLLGARDAETGQELSRDALVAETFALFAAGHETTSAAVAWTLLCLLCYPADAMSATLSDAHLDLCVKEAMRLFPPACVTIPRVAQASTALGGAILPAGAAVVVSIAAEHRNARVFVRPRGWRPERFRELGASTLAACYLPFGYGPRRCIGERLADRQVRVVVREVLRRGPWRLASEKVDYRVSQITLLPRGAMTMEASPRWERTRPGGTIGRLVDL